MVCAEHLSLWESGIVVGAWQRLPKWPAPNTWALNRTSLPAEHFTGIITTHYWGNFSSCGMTTGRELEACASFTQMAPHVSFSFAGFAVYPFTNNSPSCE